MSQFLIKAEINPNQRGLVLILGDAPTAIEINPTIHGTEFLLVDASGEPLRQLDLAEVRQAIQSWARPAAADDAGQLQQIENLLAIERAELQALEAHPFLQLEAAHV